MVTLKIRLEGNIAYVVVHVIGGSDNSDFTMQIDIVERKILYPDTEEYDFYVCNVFHGIMRRVDAGEDIEECTCMAWF